MGHAGVGKYAVEAELVSNGGVLVEFGALQCLGCVGLESSGQDSLLFVRERFESMALIGPAA